MSNEQEMREAFAAGMRKAAQIVHAKGKNAETVGWLEEAEELLYLGNEILSAIPTDSKAALSTEAQPEVTGAVVKFPESFVFVQEVIRHMSLWAEGKVMGSSRSPYDDCYPEKGDIRRVKRTAAFLLPRLKAAFDDLVEFCLLYEKRASSPSAIEAAVREKLEEAAQIVIASRWLTVEQALEIAEPIRALMESPHTSLEEPAK